VANSNTYLRTAFTSFVLVGSAMLAHVANANLSVELSNLLIQVSAIAILSTFFSRTDLSGPKLALLVTIIQGTTHFVLGGQMGSTHLMLTSHLVIGIASYLLITYFESIWNCIANWFCIVLARIIEVNYSTTKINRFVTQFLIRINLISSNQHRGPPVYGIKVV
jgi:hypothetical protein